MLNQILDQNLPQQAIALLDSPQIDIPAFNEAAAELADAWPFGMYDRGVDSVAQAHIRHQVLATLVEHPRLITVLLYGTMIVHLKRVIEAEGIAKIGWVLPDKSDLDAIADLLNDNFRGALNGKDAHELPSQELMAIFNMWHNRRARIEGWGILSDEAEPNDMVALLERIANRVFSIRDIDMRGPFMSYIDPVSEATFLEIRDWGLEAVMIYRLQIIWQYLLTKDVPINLISDAVARLGFVQRTLGDELPADDWLEACHEQVCADIEKLITDLTNTR